MNVLLKQCFIILINFLNTIDCTDNFQQELFGDGEFSKQDKVCAIVEMSVRESKIAKIF